MRKQKRRCQSSLTFENLWQEWLDTKLFITGKSRKMEGMGDEEIFKSLPADERKALLVKKDDLAAKAGIENSVRAVMSREICSCSFYYFLT